MPLSLSECYGKRKNFFPQEMNSSYSDYCPITILIQLKLCLHTYIHTYIHIYIYNTLYSSLSLLQSAYSRDNKLYIHQKYL